MRKHAADGSKSMPTGAATRSAAQPGVRKHAAGGMGSWFQGREQEVHPGRDVADVAQRRVDAALGPVLCRDNHTLTPFSKPLPWPCMPLLH